MEGRREHLDMAAIQKRLRSFAAERDWERFHSPKNLAMALAAEGGELLEIFQWLTEDQSRKLSEVDQERAAEDHACAEMLVFISIDAPVVICQAVRIEILHKHIEPRGDTTGPFHFLGLRFFRQRIARTEPFVRKRLATGVIHDRAVVAQLQDFPAFPGQRVAGKAFVFR